ncbi:MAG TPA: LLM class flavin-dependent oxidoreductase [Acidimicrobiia bacterium]|nr:LLM class flavin-dependent oxidoreductase [Acidimicrobiia bacterium]
MQLSLGMPPGPRTLELAQLAEELGYDRVWLFDSAALYEDVWIWLARLAEHTEIDLGTAVLVPNLRHVMTTASAIATVERMAPGRLACGFGTGATARWVLNKSALSWKSTRRYLEQLHALLQGDTVDIDGERCQMIHHAEWAQERPVATPFLLSAFGPKGKQVVADLYAEGVLDGYIGMADLDVDVPWKVVMTAGTVLDEGEDLSSPRLADALGPWYVVRYHGIWQAFPDALGSLPGGDEWRAAVEAERPEGERHLAVHEGHVTNVMGRDAKVLSLAGEALGTTGWVGTPEEIRARAEAVEVAGATEILYTPTGDVERELRTFAAAVRG